MRVQTVQTQIDLEAAKLTGLRLSFLHLTPPLPPAQSTNSQVK